MSSADHPEDPLDLWLEPTSEQEAVPVDRDRCKVRRARARSALVPSALEGFDWALNPYHGCAHQCAYCYAPSVLGEDRERWGRNVEA
ncbi:MAG: hypothetical protein JSW25_07470, partial [Thermoplasmata archaeon]